MDDQELKHRASSQSQYQGRAGSEKNGRKWRVVFVVALIVFVVSITVLGVIAFSYYQGQHKYGGVAETANVSDLDSTLPSQVSASEIDGLVKVDWDALLAVNPDTVAWVYIPGTSISYPVVQGQDNEHYLTYDFDGAEGWLANYGAIFVDYKNNPDWSDQLYFIYGHHMNDGSMFADIVNLEDQARFDECRTVYVLSPKGNFRLRTFALDHIAAYEEIVMARFDNDVQMRDYIQDMIANSVVVAKGLPDVSAMDKIFAFATCDNASWGRDILFAYVEDASNVGLVGTIGIKTSDGNANGFVEELEIQE